MIDREQRAKDVQAITDHFQALFEEHGRSFASLGFGREESQIRRWEVLCEVGNLAGASLLDVCCGLAGLADFLAERHPTVRYSGVEIVPAFVEDVARRRPDLDVRRFDIALDRTGERWDYVVASGMFYVEVSDNPRLVCACVANMFELCTRAVAFNTLSAYADRKDPGEYLADPGDLFAYCKTLTPYVTLRHDYMPHDFTIYLYKEAPAS